MVKKLKGKTEKKSKFVTITIERKIADTIVELKKEHGESNSNVLYKVFKKANIKIIINDNDILE